MLMRRWWGLIVLAGIGLGTVAWAELSPVSPESREEIFVIPKGTFARRMAGDKVEILPSEIHLTLGVKDVLVMKNQDDVPQLFGPVLMMPGQSFRLPFTVASRHDFACTAHVSGQLSVFVAPTPNWWGRLQSRLAAIVKPVRSL